jgi:hypothetical protein
MIADRVVAPLAAPTFAAAHDDRAQLGPAERRCCKGSSAPRSRSPCHRIRRDNNRSATVRQNNQSRRMAALHHDDAALTEAYSDSSG